MTPTHAISADEARRLLAEDRQRLLEPGEIRWVPTEANGRIARAWLFICFWLAFAAWGGLLVGRFIERSEYQCRGSR